MMNDKQLQKLIRLKRYEQPEEGYFDDFLQEFQLRQRSEMLKTSARGLFWERVKTGFAELGAMRWAVGAGAAYAAVALVLQVLPANDTSQSGASVVAIGSESEELEQESPTTSMAMVADFSSVVLALGEVESDQYNTVSTHLTRPVDFQQNTPIIFEEVRFY